MFYLKICLTGTASLAPLSAPVTKTKRILQHTVITISRNIYLGTYAFTYSCTHVLMYSCTHVLMYSCTHVLMYATCHHATASIATKTYRSTYCTYLVPQIIKKYQTHLQNILFIFIQVTPRGLEVVNATRAPHLNIIFSPWWTWCPDCLVE